MKVLVIQTGNFTFLIAQLVSKINRIKNYEKNRKISYLNLNRTMLGIHDRDDDIMCSETSKMCGLR